MLIRLIIIYSCKNKTYLNALNKQIKRGQYIMKNSFLLLTSVSGTGASASTIENDTIRNSSKFLSQHEQNLQSKGAT